MKGWCDISLGNVTAKLFACVILRLICVRSRQVSWDEGRSSENVISAFVTLAVLSNSSLTKPGFCSSLLSSLCLTLTKHTVSFSLLRLCLPFLDCYIFPKNIKYFLVLYSQICGFNLLSFWVPKILPGRVADPLTSHFVRVDWCKTSMCFSSVAAFLRSLWSSLTISDWKVLVS